MAFVIDDNGNITLIQGDSGELTINGIDTSKNYTAYLAVQDNKRRPIGTEIQVQTNYNSSVVFVFLPEFTNLFSVPKNDETADYYYGIKLCDDEDYEDTLLIGTSKLGDLNTITVYPKKVEGVINDQ